MNIDIGRAFTYVSEDPNGVKKVLIGGGICLLFVISFITIIGWIPIGFILSGYFIQTVRNVIAGEQYPLPEWDNWGERLVDGAKSWLIGFVFALPAAILSGIFQLPGIINSVVSGMNGNTSSSGVSAATGGLGLFGSYCLAPLLSIACGLLVPIAIGRYAASRDLGQAFQFGEVIATLRQHVANYVVIALLSFFVFQYILPLIGLIGICIGAAFTTFYAQIVQAHLYGQAHRNAVGQMQPSYGAPYGGDPYGNQRPF